MKGLSASSAAPVKLLLMGDARQVHLRKWASYFLEIGARVLTLSLEGSSGFPGEFKKIDAPSVIPGFARYPLAVSSARKAAARFEPDIINAHFLPNYGFMAALMDKKPWVLSTWGSDIMLLPQKSPFHRWRTKFVLERTTFVTSDAKVMSNRLIDLGCDPGSILTVPYGVDILTFHPNDGATTDGGPSVISNRKLEKIYNIETVIESFALASTDMPLSRLTIAGNGSLKKNLRKAAAKSGAHDQILFIPGTDHADMPDLLRSHDIFISLAWSDTTSVSLLEAMACGLFPIVGDIPANREWITNGENGFLVDPSDPAAASDALKKAWKDRDLAAAAAKANLQIIKERALWRSNMTKVSDLFMKIIDADTKTK